jgi:hypothetical protein
MPKLWFRLFLTWDDVLTDGIAAAGDEERALAASAAEPGD